MKLTVQQVMDATVTVSNIIRENRPMPQRGKYKLARLHAKLLPEFNTANDQRNAMIKAYDHHPMVNAKPSKEDPLGQNLVESPDFAVPNSKVPEFTEAWAKIASEQIDVDVEPIPLEQFSLADDQDGSISAHELIVLGDLVKD
ncbi:MAG: hypothetical protein KGL39_46040 [Patescibacteria group bacterium]|nr:hypothetical protein [Patescibacteria group bacterium]